MRRKRSIDGGLQMGHTYTQIFVVLWIVLGVYTYTTCRVHHICKKQKQSKTKQNKTKMRFTWRMKATCTSASSRRTPRMNSCVCGEGVVCVCVCVCVCVKSSTMATPPGHFPPLLLCSSIDVISHRPRQALRD